MPLAPHPAPIPSSALLISVHGIVQGVGFRPFVYRLAHQLGLAGHSDQQRRGECPSIFPVLPPCSTNLSAPCANRSRRRPASAGLRRSPPKFCPLDASFQILPSQRSDRPSTQIAPDMALCDDCLAEILDPQNRRFRYPFTNCTNCGPRFSIVERIPYDRPNTSMRVFPMCETCSREYHDPLDRRFHAQPNACPVCGRG